MNLEQLAGDDFCYLTTTGRVTGRSHTIEIWFALHGSTLYMLSGGGSRADWVKNLRHDPRVTIRLGTEHISGHARVVDDTAEDARARQLLVDKYAPRYAGDLSDWGRTALPVAVDLSIPEDQGDS